MNNTDKILNIALIVVILIAISKISKFFKAPDESKEEVDDKNCEGTYPDNWYLINADVLEKAGFDIGTDVKTIFRVFGKLKSDCDFEKLFNAYGKRFYNVFWKYNMIEFLDAELSNSDREKINSIMKSNGITYSI
jgi:hypothetical protein